MKFFFPSVSKVALHKIKPGREEGRERETHTQRQRQRERDRETERQGETEKRESSLIHYYENFGPVIFHAISIS